MDFNISALGASPMSFVAPSSPTASADSSGNSTDSPSIGPAATLEISSLQLQGQMVSTLFGGFGGGTRSLVGSMIDALA